MAADLPRARPALRRRTERRLVSGVAGGVADWLNASPFFVRVVMGLLLFWEPAVWAYAAATLLLPPRGHDRPGLDNLIALARLGLIFLMPWLLLSSGNLGGYLEAAPHVAVPFAGLSAVGLVVVLSADHLRGRPRTAAEERAAVLGAAPLGLSVLLIAGGIVLLEDVRWERFLPVCALVAGAALLLGARAGRPRPFVAPAVVAVALAGIPTAAGVRLDGGVGDAGIAPSRIDGAPLVVRRAFGDVEIDLRRTVSQRPVVVRVSVGKGDLGIALPDRGRVVVDARVGQGELDSNPVNGGGSSLNGLDLEVSHRWRPVDDRPGPPPKALAPAIHVIAEVGIGELKATRTGGISPFPVGP